MKKITKIKRVLSQREMSKIMRDKNTICLSSIEKRKHKRYEKAMSDLKAKIKLLILITILVALAIFTAKVYGDIELEVKQEIDPLEQVLEIPEVRDVVEVQTVDEFEDLTQDLSRMTNEEYLDKQTEAKKFNINKLAYAVAYQETHNCEKGYGKTHNNCFGIKHGNTVPCPGVPKMAICKFDTPEESYEAFKIIWSKWYGELPTYRLADKWTGGDRTQIWLNNVLKIYNSELG